MNKTVKLGLIGCVSLITILMGLIGIKHVKGQIALLELEEVVTKHNLESSISSIDLKENTSFIGKEYVELLFKNKSDNQEAFKINFILNPQVFSNSLNLTGSINLIENPNRPISSNGKELASLNGEFDSNKRVITASFNEITLYSNLKDKANPENNLVILPFIGQIQHIKDSNTTITTINNFKVLGTKDSKQPNNQYKVIDNLNFTNTNIQNGDNIQHKLAATLDGLNYYNKIGYVSVGKIELANDYTNENDLISNKNYTNINNIKSNIIRGMEYNTSYITINTAGKFNIAKVDSNQPIKDSIKTLISNGLSLNVVNLTYKSLLGSFNLSTNINTKSNNNSKYNFADSATFDLKAKFNHEFLNVAQPYLRKLTVNSQPFNFENLEVHYSNNIAISNPESPLINDSIIDTVNQINLLFGNQPIKNKTLLIENNLNTSQVVTQEQNKLNNQAVPVKLETSVIKPEEALPTFNFDNK